MKLDDFAKKHKPFILCETFVINFIFNPDPVEDVDVSNPIGFDSVGPTEDEFYEGDTEIDDPQDAPP